MLRVLEMSGGRGPIDRLPIDRLLPQGSGFHLVTGLPNVQRVFLVFSLSGIM